MAWVRLDDSAMTDLKIVRLPDSAFRLWIKGLCYCQMHLTDGLIPREALGPMEAKRRDIDALCQVLVPGKAALWEASADGFHVHDYLDYNDSRADVAARKDKDRKRKRPPGAHAELRVESEKVSIRNPRGNPQDFPFCSVVSSGIREGVQGEPTALAERAGRLVERYGELYAELRRGAKHLRSKPALEWDKACQLVALWDDAHLEKLARIFLTTDEPWIASTGREFLVFASKASWADDKLREWEAKNRVRA